MKTPLLSRFFAASLLILAAVSSLPRASAATGTNSDLSITKNTSSSNLVVGSNVVFTLTLQNFGPNSVGSAITVTDCLPAGLTYVTDSTVGNTNNGTYSAGTCWWTLPGGLATGGSVTITITAQATTAGTYTNTASVGPPAGYLDFNTNNNSSSVTLTLVSNSPPLSIDCSTNITVTATSSNGATVFFTVSASGGCTTPFVSAYPPSGSVFPPGTTTVMATATDTCGHSTNCTFTVTVVLPPISIDCSTNITVMATGPSGATVFFTLSATGGCSTPFITATPPSGSTFPIGTTTVFVNASDTCGTATNCSFSVTVIKSNCVLSIQCPSNITVTNNGPTNIFFTVTASDSCGGLPNVTSMPPSGSSFPVGMTTVTSTASDANGSTNCSFTVTVVQPTCILSITCPSNITVTNNGPTNIFFAVTASDSCGGVPTVNSMPPSGSSFPVGMTTVTSMASDINGSTNCSFTVTVVKPNCILSITCPPNITVTNNGPTPVFFSVTASDSCGGLPNVTSIPASGSTFPLGTTTVTSTASDTNGSTNCSFSVTVTNAITNADLMVTKTASTNTVQVGQQVVFTVLLTNLGPSYISNSIVVTDCIPAGYQYVTDNTYGSTNNGSYSPGTCWWTWSSGLGVGTVAQLQITALAITNGVFTNTAIVGVPAGVLDTNLTNNSSSAVVTNTLPVADLRVTKTSNVNNPQVGQQVVFSVTLANLGPDSITNQVLVTDCLPSGFQYVSDNSYGNYNTIGQYSAGTCLWTLPFGISTTNPITLQITTLATTNLCATNTASVAVPNGVTDPNLGNNSASVNLCINPLWTISGFVRNCSSNGSALSGVTVTLTGATNLTTTTSASGAYSFTNLPSGAYTVTPAQAGNTFMPANANVTLTTAGATIPTFTGSVPLISGQITYSTNGAPISNVLVTLTGPVNTTTLTSANGAYLFTNTPPGTYTITPTPTNGYVFAPTNKTVTLTVANCSTNANFTASNRTVQLVAMEVTQVIQDWSNSVMLVAAKKTYLRAHMQLPTNTVPAVLVQGARLYGSNNGVALPGSPLSPINTNGSLLVNTTNAPYARSNWNSALNFQLPASWTTGTITMQFVWSNNVTLVINCPPPAGGTNGIVTCTFSNMPAIPVRYYGYNFTNAGVVQEVDGTVFTNLGAVLTATYPVPDISRDIAQYIGPSMLNVPPVIPPVLTNRPHFTEFGEWAILLSNTRLQTTRLLDRVQGAFGGGVSNVVYYGAMAGLAPDTLGWANSFLVESNTDISRQQLLIASGYIGTSIYGRNYRQTHTHEIGHTIGRPHDLLGTNAQGRYVGTCGEGGPPVIYPLFQTVPGFYTNKPAIGPMTLGTNALIYGLDTAALNDGTVNPVVSPYACFDFMGYCTTAPLDAWVSPYTYAALATNIATNFATVTPPIATPAKTYLLVRGVVSSAATNTYIQRILTFTATKAPPTNAPGRYFLQFYDALSNLVSQVSFNPDQFENEDESDIEEGTLDTFLIPVEVDNTNIASIDLYDSAFGMVVGSMSGSSNAPSVSGVNLTTTGGGSFSGVGNLIINWLGTDLNLGALLTYTVQYSADNGVTWTTLDPDFSGNTLTIDSSTLLPTTQGLIQVIASDGFNSSAPAYSSLFTIPPHAPLVTIYTPSSGAVYVGDQQIFFDAGAIDQIDGVLSGNNVQWVSSRNGVLGYGAQLNLEADTLSEGLHTITAFAFGSSGLIGNATVQIFVLNQLPPQLAINYQSLGNSFVLTWPSAYTNYALQSTPSLSPSSWSHVTNTPVVNGAFQSVTVSVTNTSAYFRLNLQ